MRSIDDLAAEVRAAYVEEAAELLRRAEGSLLDLASADEHDTSRLLLGLLRTLHTWKGAAAASGEDRVKNAIHDLEGEVRRLQTSERRLDPAELDDLHRRVESLRSSTFADATSNERLVVPAPKPAEPVVDEPRIAHRDGVFAKSPMPELSLGRGVAEDRLRVKPEKVESLHALVGDLVVVRLQHEALTARIVELREQADELSSLVRKHAIELGGSASDGRRATAGRVKELGAVISAVANEIGSLAKDAPMIEVQSASVIASLENGIRDLLLMPLQPFFEDYAKVVREAARECGKKAKLVVRAEGAEVDRSVLVRLREPLLHLVRNAVVHGLESPERRAALGKPEVGTVLLEAHCEGPRAILRVADDGAGIDVAAVRSKAASLGMLDTHAFDDEALLETLSRPGFSTVATADALAGRGIGIDVAAATTRALGGTLRLENLPGAGCFFTIEVPVSTSTSAGLVVRVAEQSFGLLLTHVSRIVRVGEADLVRVEGRDAIVFDGAPIAVVSLAALLGMPPARLGGAKKPCLVTESGRRKLALVVDEIPGEREMVVKPLSRGFASVRTVSGGAIEADGSVLPVLNVAALFDLASSSGALTRAMVVTPDRRARGASVLVVDDSLTMRMLLRNILEASGYEVVLAHDGAAALEEVERSEPFDLVVSDLQMPRLDGVGLCRGIRSSRHPQTPVVIVTSVGDADEKQRAIDAGADGYVVKSEFEQTRFLTLVEALVGRGGAAA